MNIFAASLFVLLIPNLVSAKPQRIASLNLCTDQIVLLLAKPENVAAVSYLSRDSASSYMADAAQSFATTHGTVEEILTLQPDLIFTGRFTSQASVTFLHKIGFRIVTLDTPEDFKEIRTQVRQVAALLQEKERGEDLISQMDRRLEWGNRAKSENLATAAFYLPNGYTYGARTTIDALLKISGLRNVVSELGITGTAVLSLERLIATNPEILILNSFGDGSVSIAEEMLRHPIFTKSMKGKMLIRVPTRLWVCPGPMLAEAVEILVGSRP